jgi:putative MATE family efflux protein
MENSNYLLKDSITKGLVRFAIPVMLSMILQILYSAVDLLVVGNFATTADMAGVTVSSQVMSTVMLAVSGITTGLTVLVGRFSGAGSERDVTRAIGSSITLFALVALGLTVLAACLTGPVVAAMKTPPEAVGAARSYLRICSLGIVFIVGYNVISSIFRGIGDSKTPLLFVGIACVVNIVLDLLFIKGFGMGAAGAALATVIAQAGSLAASALYLCKKGIGFRFERDDFRLRRAYAFKMLRIGLPISLQEVLINLSFLLITAVVNKMAEDNGLGAVPSAAVGTVEKLIGFLMMPTLAVSTAVATMSAHNAGANRPDRSVSCLRTGIVISLAIGAAACAFCWLSGSALTSLFSNNPAVVEEASLYLKTYSLDCVVVAFVFNFNAFFTSLGKSVFSMAHSLLTTFLIRVPFVIITGGMAGVTLFAIGFAAPLSSLGSLIICLVYFIRLSRRLKADAALQKAAVPPI